MGPALGSIIAKTIAAHIRATTTKPIRPQSAPGMASTDRPKVGWQAAANRRGKRSSDPMPGPSAPDGPPMPEISSASQSQPSPVMAMMQKPASHFGRASMPPSRPAAWERCVRLRSVLSVMTAVQFCGSGIAHRPAEEYRLHGCTEPARPRPRLVRLIQR